MRSAAQIVVDEKYVEFWQKFARDVRVVPPAEQETHTASDLRDHQVGQQLGYHRIEPFVKVRTDDDRPLRTHMVEAKEPSHKRPNSPRPYNKPTYEPGSA